MANKASGQGKIWKTELAVVLTIAVLCAPVPGGKYLYHASSNGEDDFDLESRM